MKSLLSYKIDNVTPVKLLIVEEIKIICIIFIYKSRCIH